MEAAVYWVEKYAGNWPEVEWEKKDLGTLCVIVPNRHVVRPACVHIRSSIETACAFVHVISQ